ncbi:TetR/AcrR family transcriptional regulator [Natranaerofaba carboxydovora]|uniref:TetR/AcrR family transcriptional regulator n=1 Tax=Natranaerofaba carboxydovora TaxID=2742683 RepID=UPI001F12D3C1|nr:TetR/AcrR family transcriptional regulator [Natranaerofaba carboxydovora]UMZ73275.1 Fatty acid metabolism regulator protein [Natranaerofaba carboxydovora]
MAIKKGEKYEAIIEAATKVIAQNGYYEAKVSQIAKEAELGDGTVYLYFKNKQDILISVMEEKMGNFLNLLEKRLKTKSSSLDKLYLLVDTHFNFLAEDFNLALFTQVELRQANKEIRAGIEPSLKTYYNIILQVLEQGIEEKVFSENLNKRAAASMIFGTLDETVTSWVMADGKFDILARVDPVYSLLTNGLKGEIK